MVVGIEVLWSTHIFDDGRSNVGEALVIEERENVFLDPVSLVAHAYQKHLIGAFA